MTRIIQVIKAMTSNIDKIRNVKKAGYVNFYFLYDNKHKWAINNDNGNDEYLLTLYPINDITIEEIINREEIEIEEEPLDSILYRSSDHKSREATESYAELYNIVKSKVFGVDDIFNDILK